MPKLALKGPNGQLTFLIVAVFIGLTVGSGAIDFGALLHRGAARASKVTPADLSAASAVAGAVH